MAIKKYAGLDNNYLPTDGSVPVALGDEAIELTVTSGNVSQAVSLEGYDKIAFVTEGDTNTSIDFLELLGSETTDATLEIVKDVTASSGYALKLTGIQKLVFGTRISYVPDILKKVTLKAKKDTGNTGNLYASVVSYANGQYRNKSGNISIEDYVSVVDTSSLTTSYTTNVGYVKGVGTNYIEPASDPNSPSELPATTDEVALILEATGASDIWYIDVISLEEVENSIRDIPDGEGVYSSSQNFNTRNDRITATPANPVVTTPSTYTLNDDGSIDITFTWTFSGTGDAYNIDGFSICTHSSDTSTPPTFSDSAVYVDATTRNFTLYGITINKYYTIGVQAYRQIDHDIAVDLTLSEDVLRSAIVQSTPYRPVNITPSTTSYAIQRNVNSYLGSASLGSIYIHGYYPNGMRGDIAGQILYNEGSTATDMYLAINAQAVDCTDFTYTADTEFTCYLVLNAGAVKPAIYDINTNTFVNDIETVSSGVVIGYVIVDYAHSGTVYTIKDTFVYESAKLLSMSKTTKLEEAWKYLSEATSQSDWESRVDDLGIENSFTFLAAYNAFITNLKAENVTAGTGDGTTGGFRFRAMSDRDMDGGNIPVFDIYKDDKQLFKVDPSTGKIYFGKHFWYDPSDGAIHTPEDNTLIRADGTTELLGTLRTGLNAPTDARVAIQDESGITSGPTFTGSGLNDLTITNEGDVAGDFRVKISGINNATNSGKQGYWATPFQVGTNSWVAIAVNSSGRFVAVGLAGYVSYSDDGITWVTPFRVGTNDWSGIAVNSSGRFVAVGAVNISYSDDGITWATPFRAGNVVWYGIAVNSSGRFVAVGTSGHISYSDDGITWATPFEVGTYVWYGIAVNSSGRFVAVGWSGHISYSDDGITWVTPFKVGDSNYRAIAVNSSGGFVAVGDKGYVSYSDDGITWVTPFQVGTRNWEGVAVNSAGRFVAVGVDGYVSYSNDGITWATPFEVGTYVWYGIAVNSAGRFVAGGLSGYITMSSLQDTIQISSNGGTTWGSDIPIPLNGSIPITGFGIDILFGHTEGHTVGDYWSFKQGAMRGLAITDSEGNEYFSASNGEVTIKTVNATTVKGAVFN